MPPTPAACVLIVVQATLSLETSIVYALPYAASQLSRTRDTAVTAPRSTLIHCGSLNADDQRVVALPSTARLAVLPAFSTEEAVAGLFKARLVPAAAVAVGVGVAVTVGVAVAAMVAVNVAVGPEVVAVAVGVAEAGASETSRPLTSELLTTDVN